MQSIFRLAWCQDQAGDKKLEKPLLPQMKPASIVDMPLFNSTKRKRSSSTDYVESYLPDGNKRRKPSSTEQLASLPSSIRLSDAHSMPEHDEQASELLPHVDSEMPAAGWESHPTAMPAIPATTHVPNETPDVEKQNRESTQENATADLPRVDTVGAQSAIEHQLNLEILLKHRELRLIEQELAKCQIALEQLRRCEVVPYPGFSGPSENISTGTGPALKPEPRFTHPQAPAPWGVTDGPYTRHYSKWLLNDSTFDSVAVQQAQNPSSYSSAIPEGRSTRNSVAGLSKTNKSRPARDSVGNLNNALPNYPLHTRGKGGPLIIKRLADNKFVKLICNNCQRGDFSSVQGFLNHCRIAHKVDYKSHEAAASGCGRLLGDDELHLIPQTTPVAPVAVAPRAPSHKAAPVTTQPLPAGAIHPLNAPVIPRYTWKVQAAAARAAAKTAKAAAATNAPEKVGKLDETGNSSATATTITNNLRVVKSFHSAPLVAAPETPYLSSHFAKRGLGGDLRKAASQASVKIDLGPEMMEEDEHTQTAPRKASVSTGVAYASTMRFSQVQSDKVGGRSQSRKGRYAPASRPRPAPLAPRMDHDLHHRVSVEIPESPQDPDFSPHTADSNPGLVSDHEDDDVASELDEARSERHVSPVARVGHLGGLRSGVGACGADTVEVDLEVEDDGEGHHGVLIRPRGLAYQEFSSRPGGSPSQRPVSRFGEAAK